MVRGKYTARAAQGRADSAELKADRTAQKLAEEKQAHADEVAALKARIETLTSQLTHEVKNLAAAEVKRTEEEWSARLAAEQQRQHEAALQVFERMRRSVVHNVNTVAGIPGAVLTELVADLAELLKVPAGVAEATVMRDSVVKSTRTTRRTNASKLRAAAQQERATVIKGGN